MRITAILTHPIQYYSPWFREIHSNCSEIDLTVIYVMIPTAAQQGVGFGTEFQWDISLLDGYEHVTLRQAKTGDNLHSDRFFGMDARGIGAVIESTTPDAALIPGWYSISLVRAALACRKRGIPVIYRGDTQLSKGRPPLKQALSAARTSAMISNFDAFLTVGKRNAEYLSAVGVPASKMFRAPHAVDNDFFRKEAARFDDPAARQALRQKTGIAPDDYALLFVGKLEVKKRPWQVIEAAAELGPSTVVVIAGTGEAEERCRETAARLGVRTVFKGFVNQSHLGEVYGTSECLVLPSDERETWGLVVNEAMASGLPCIVSDAVGCGPDLILDGKTGVSFPLDDPVLLSQAARTIRDAAAAGFDFAHHCRQHVAQYSFKAATDGLLEAARYVMRNK